MRRIRGKTSPLLPSFELHSLSWSFFLLPFFVSISSKIMEERESVCVSLSKIISFSL